jgi:protein-S-isoprenylcysteine O-methyltransferase Ste14
MRPRDGAVLHTEGFIALAIGAILLLWCVRDFYVMGKGTLGPWDPPRNLVVTGLYRYSRNPMYIAVVLILIGWAMLYREQSLWVYAAVVAAFFHLRVVAFEERYLAKTHGAAFASYKTKVGRWV